MNIVTAESGGSVVGPVVGVIVAVTVVAILVILTIVFIRYCTDHSLVKSIQCMNRVSCPRWRRRGHSGSVKIKSKPLSPPRRLRREEEGESEEMEMEGLADSAEDKDDYYFEDPANIGSHQACSTLSFHALSCTVYLTCSGGS